MAKPRSRWKWIVAGLVVLALVGAGFLLPVGAWAEALQQWAEAQGPIGMLWFGLLYVVLVLAFVPASALTVAAGFAFGFGYGLLVVSIAATAAATIAFVLARTLARERVERLVARNKKFRAFDEAVEAGDWKVVALMRLSLLLPFNVSNYAFGLTQIGLGTYVVTSFFAMLPGTALYVYLGNLGRLAGGKKDHSPLEYAFFGAGLVASAILVVYVTRMARARLGKGRKPSRGGRSGAAPRASTR